MTDKFYGKKHEKDGSRTAEYGEWLAERAQERGFKSFIDYQEEYGWM
jgi:hypothetical protein